MRASARLCLKSEPYFQLLQVVIIKYGVLFSNPCMKKLNGRVTISVLTVLATAIAFPGLMGTGQAFAQGATDVSGGSKLLGAGLAFGLAAAGAGIGLGFVGAAGLAAISDNPKMQSRVFIFVGMVESIAIYGIVMMFIILGQ
jgi:V/A-type H+/Na+-transporting ATPase subunit K